MPKGPHGEKRPADAVGRAVIATGEEPDDREEAPALSPAAQLGKLGGAARGKEPYGGAAEGDCTKGGG